MIKKMLFAFAALAISSLSAFAQMDDENIGFINLQKNTFSIGIKAGGNISTMSQPDICDLYDKSGMGFSGGVSMNMRFGKASENSPAGTGLIALGLDLMYRQSTVKTIAFDDTGKENANLSLGYFDVPLYVQFYPFMKSASMNTLHVEVGAAFAGTLSRSPETLTVPSKAGGSSSIIFNINTDKSKLKGMDVRPFAGIGYTIPNTGIDISARYYLGTSDLAGNMQSKISSAEISIAWMFKKWKF